MAGRLCDHESGRARGPAPVRSIRSFRSPWSFKVLSESIRTPELDLDRGFGKVVVMYLENYDSSAKQDLIRVRGAWCRRLEQSYLKKNYLGLKKLSCLPVFSLIPADSLKSMDHLDISAVYGNAGYCRMMMAGFLLDNYFQYRPNSVASPDAT